MIAPAEIITGIATTESPPARAIASTLSRIIAIARARTGGGASSRSSATCTVFPVAVRRPSLTAVMFRTHVTASALSFGPCATSSSARERSRASSARQRSPSAAASSGALSSAAVTRIGTGGRPFGPWSACAASSPGSSASSPA